MVTEKRQHQRVSTLNLLYYVCLDDEGSHLDQGMGKTLDISQGGILIETHIQIEAKFIMLLALGFEEELVDIKGEVVYSRKNESGMYESGIKLLETDDKITGIVDKLIEDFIQKKAQS